MDFDESILKEFVIESQEHFENIEDDILQLSRQKESPDRELVDKIFRAIHSVKGGAGFLRLEKIGKLSHVMETLLSMVRAGQMKPDSDLIDTLLAGVDLLNVMLKNVEQSNEFDISVVYNRLNTLFDLAKSQEIQNDLESDVQLSTGCGYASEFEINRFSLKNLPPNQEFLYILKYDLVQLSIAKKKGPVLLVKELLNAGQIVDSKIQASSRDLAEGVPTGPLMYSVLYSTGLNPDSIYETLNISKDAVILIDKEKLLKADENIVSGKEPPVLSGQPLSCEDQDDEIPFAETESEPEQNISLPELAEDKDKSDVRDFSNYRTLERSDIRVDLEKLDVLLNLMGELVIAETMVTDNSDLRGLELENFERSARNLRRIISELQDVTMSIRMIPLSKTFRKGTRLVHDLSLKEGKKIRLDISGEETEVDKSIIEQFSDPLLHIIRNCIDHGIEFPHEREAAGKPETGVVAIEAKNEGGEVIIRIADDGRGLNREKILDKAFEHGLIGPDDKVYDINRLILEPGFSTVEKVTDVSGRGVGLDVVRRNLEKLKGKIDIRSTPDRGTTIIFRIPLTLAIIDGMLVRVGSSNYTIPLLSIRESFRPDTSQITMTMDSQEVVRIRDDLISVVRLHDLYNIVPEQTELDKGILINVVSGSKAVCLFADEIIGHIQTVIKGMPGYVASARGVSGCTILSNGDVSLILDVATLIEIAENET
ncbi:MAG: chemotaxis protein CheA [Desulfobacteraceae bacterium]|nr:chemotaxis protein CheA [Desulfobacteraceae bacterium]